MGMQRSNSDSFSYQSLENELEKYSNIAFRGDSRDPKEIFEFGFQRIGASQNYFMANNKKIQEPTIRLMDPSSKTKGGCDVVATSAVCLTLDFDCASIFPIESADAYSPLTSKTWIYIVHVENAYMTYKKQIKEGSILQFCREIAARDIPSGDVLCAIQCERYLNLNQDYLPTWHTGMHYALHGEIYWNPKLNNETKTKIKMQRKEMIERIVKAHQHQYLESFIPKNEFEANIFNRKPSTPLPISAHEHTNRLLLINFAMICTDFSSLPLTKTLRSKLAIQALHGCFDVNQLIPGTNNYPLMIACHYKLTEVVKELLGKGANPEALKDDGIPIHKGNYITEIQTLLNQAISSKAAKSTFSINGFFQLSILNTIKTSASLMDRIVNSPGQ